MTHTEYQDPKIDHTSWMQWIEGNLVLAKDFYKEVVQELLKRIYLPIYLPLLSLVACFLIIKSKESESYTKLKFFLFSIGIIIIIFSKLSIKFASINQLAFLTFLLVPCLIFYLTFNIFKTRARKI